jgi:hypothetical protein
LYIFFLFGSINNIKCITCHQKCTVFEKKQKFSISIVFQKKNYYEQNDSGNFSFWYLNLQEIKFQTQMMYFVNFAYIDKWSWIEECSNCKS